MAGIGAGAAGGAASGALAGSAAGGAGAIPGAIIGALGGAATAYGNQLSNRRGSGLLGSTPGNASEGARYSNPYMSTNAGYDPDKYMKLLGNSYRGGLLG